MPDSKTRLVCDRSHMREELERLNPSHVAVAYVGRDWRQLLGSPGTLEEIVVAPVPGTNPKAVKELVELLGWDKVHFFDQLHAKVYLGASGVMVGSANLSSNALLPGGTQLYEMVVVTEDTGIREQAMQEWSRYRALARSLYPTQEDKIARLKALQKKAIESALQDVRDALPTRTTPSLSGFKVGSQAIHLEWGQSSSEADSDPNDTNFINTRVGRSIDEYNVGDWVLQWESDDEGRPSGRAPLTWMRIDEVRLGGAIGEELYVDQLAERVEPNKSMHPFKLDQRVQKAFKQLMAKSDLRPDSLDDPSNEAIPLTEVDEFLKELQQLYVEMERA